jgi:hypothetical protein
MVCVLPECLGDSILPSPRCPSPPYRGSSSPTAAEIATIEEGDSRDSVESRKEGVKSPRSLFLE